jgi:hypothetical protein
MTDLPKRLQHLEHILGHETRVKLELPDYGGIVWLNRVDSTRFTGSYDLTSQRGRFLLDAGAKIIFSSITENIGDETIATPEQIEAFQDIDVKDRLADELIEQLLIKKQLANN